MNHVWNLILTFHWRKRHIVWLFVSIIILYICTPFINSIALGENSVVSTAFSQQIIEIIGLLFLLYFGSTILSEFNKNKTIQLLRSKKKEPLWLITQLWTGTYTVYALYIIVAINIWWLIVWRDVTIVQATINLLISWAIVLSIVMCLSCITHPYAAIIWSLIIYSMSYSINFIIFSTPNLFKESISYKILTVIQYLFPRLDLLYSTSWNSWIRASLANMLYAIVIFSIFVCIFLYSYKKQ